jgi:hypothetical protein
MQRARLALGAAILLTSACGAAPGAATSPVGPGPTQAPESPAGTRTPPAPTTSPAPTPRPRPSGTLAWPTGFADELASGSYFTSPPFDVPMTITITEPGWHAGHMNPVFIDLQRYDDVEVGGLPTLLLGFALPENVRGADGAVDVAGLTPGAAIELITSRASVRSGDRAAIQLLGLPGERVDLHSDLGNNPIFGSAEGDFGMQPELDLRLVALPHEAGLMMVLVMAPADDLHAAWEQALRTLETIALL